MNTVVTRSDWTGRRIEERFPLLEWLGDSGRSSVFLTELREEGLQKAVIRLIPADDRAAKGHISHWTETGKLSHPHLVRQFHSGRCRIDTAPFHYIITEYADEVLSEILPGRPLTPDESREMLVPVLDALSYLHSRGFVHGHLKPSNILVIGDQLKLSADSLHAAGEVDEHFATPTFYDAPELASAAIYPTADVWSLGVTLVEALTQHAPVGDRSADRGPVVPEHVPEPFSEIALECLRRDPARRCTIGDIKERLAGKIPRPRVPDAKPASPQVAGSRSADPRLADLGLSDTRLPDLGLPEPAGKPQRKFRGTDDSRRRWWVFTTGFLLLVALAAVLLFRSPHSERGAPVEEKPSPAPQSAPPEPARPAVGNSVKGAVVQRVMPDVPERASRTIHGQVTVKIRVTVDTVGNVSDATFESRGPSQYFANLALQAARRWKFKPAQASGRAVPSAWILRFAFRQSGTDVNVVEANR
jgi:TonB family protein